MSNLFYFAVISFGDLLYIYLLLLYFLVRGCNGVWGALALVQGLGCGFYLDY
jgi:predicted small secreted protein